MNSLVVHHLPETSAASPGQNGALAVGRGPDNDLVLDHPTVSHHHALIERVDGQYFITDLGSRNATRVNGRTVRQRRALAHGDKIRFGQVRVRFVVNADDAQTASFADVQGPPMESGVLFNCPSCDTRLWAKGEATGGVVTCGHCKADVVVPGQSTRPDSGETVAGMAVSAATSELAAPSETGRCGICQWHTTNDDEITRCPSCGLTFHASCWRENRGCAAYGCAQVNALAPRPERPESPNSIGAAAAPMEDAAPITEQPTTAIDHAFDSPQMTAGHALLAGSVGAALLGMLAFGVPSAGAFILSVVMAAKRPAQRKMLLLAAALSALGVAAGVAVSSAWWLGWTPGGSTL